MFGRMKERLRRPNHSGNETRSSASRSNQVAPANDPAPVYSVQPDSTHQAQSPTNTAEPTPPPYAGSSPWPQHRDIESGLSATIYYHTISTATRVPLPCWTYISSGLATESKQQQKQPPREAAFTIVRRPATEPESEPPEFPLLWFSQLHALAQQGHTTVDHGFTTLEVGEFLDRTDWSLMLYFDHARFPGTLPASITQRHPPFLHVIPLLASEAAVARRYGMFRALSHLGLRASQFPWPVWVDRDREAVISLADMEGSLRDKVAVNSIYGVSMVMVGTKLLLYVAEQAVEKVAAAVNAAGMEQVLALESFLYQGADAARVWKNQFTQAVAYARGIQATCLQMGFVMFCPQQNADQVAHKEDGVVLLLTDVSWTKIRQALSSGKPVTVPMANNVSFEVTFNPPGISGVPVGKSSDKYIEIRADAPIEYKQ